MADDIAKTGGKPPSSVFIHARNTEATPNEGKLLSCDAAGNLLVGVPGGVEVNNFPDPQNVNIASQDAPLEVEDLELANTATTTTPTVTTSSTTVLAANANRKGALISNPLGGSTVFLNFGGAATVAHHPLKAEGRLELGRTTMSVTGIVGTGTQALVVTEFT